MQQHSVHSMNESVSAALLHRTAETGKKVVQLRFSRRCKALRDVLLESMELAPSRQILEAAGFPVELESGLKVLVKPEHYEALMGVIKGQTFSSQDVIVEPELESVVLQLVNGLKKKEKVYPRGSQVIPLGFLLAAKDANLKVSFSKRTINIKVPSSLRSSSATDEGHKTV